MVITLTPQQQAYVDDLMRDGSFESEEAVITEALHALRDERTTARIRELTEEGLASIREHGTREGGEALKERLEKAVKQGLAEGRKPSDHIIHGIGSVFAQKAIWRRSVSTR